MKQDILAHLEDPAYLENLYRSNKSGFKQSFQALYPDIRGSLLAECWQARLDQSSGDISWGSRTELILVIVLGLIAGCYAKFPEIFGLDEEFFYPRNLGFIVFPFVAAYFAWRNHLPLKILAIIGAILGICITYVNLIPDTESDVTILVLIHTPLLLWALLGAAFTGANLQNLDKRLDYLRFNGDAIVIGAVLVLSGAALSGLTIGLFDLIGIRIEEFYTKYILVFGATCIPPFAAFLTQTNPQLVNKVSPVIAKVFSPLVLVMLVVYLIAIVYSGKDPYNDREFLLLFNFLLIGVMALIFFSIAESSDQKKGAEAWVLAGLSSVTIIVNGIALSAILFRISEWGITPNRLAVLGVNVLMLVHLILVFRTLIQAMKKGQGMKPVGKRIATYLPIYFIWTLIIVFVFPMIFGFK